jgi:hypothetical protein
MAQVSFCPLKIFSSIQAHLYMGLLMVAGEKWRTVELKLGGKENTNALAISNAPFFTNSILFLFSWV